ncbi:YciI-like protein [Salinispirillum sp. LH 10-3-1]|uniref:YciI-like protein n=1 Tax=Salinispirillum sp. LH 10-3-1 TaxID=2952525 RepID=A0AB38YE41_9GAMM
MHYILFYDYSADYLERRSEFRDEHLAMAWAAQGAGQIVLAGALAEPADGAVLIFDVESPDVIERFAEADPYVRNGLVTGYRIRPWTTVVGDLAGTPIKPG